MTENEFDGTCSGADRARLLAWPSAAAQDWPTRPITLMVPFAAGGGIDSSARIQAQQHARNARPAIVVENVGAAAGTTGARARRQGAARRLHVPDRQHRHACLQPGAVQEAALQRGRRLRAGRAGDRESPRILVARKDLPVNDLQELIAYLKANQGKMQFGSAGVGSGTHLPACCSTPRSASTSRTCPIAATDRRCRT